MMRRPMLEEPPSRLARWSRGCALFATAVAALAVILTRGGFVEATPGVAILGGAIALALAAVAFALGAFVVIWVNGNPGLGRAVLGLFLGLSLVAYPAYVVALGYRAPAIADIATDTADPPRFEVIARLRPKGANPTGYDKTKAGAQRAAYPELAPLLLPAAPAEVYNSAFEVVSRRKWRIVDARTPQAGRRDGRIEAVALSTIMGFRDDIVVRVRASGGGSLVDIRSASRYGTRDLGSNARRVRSLLDEIAEEVGNQPAPR